MFTINALDSTYQVTYTTPAAGVVLYYVKEIRKQKTSDATISTAEYPALRSLKESVKEVAVDAGVAVGAGAGLGIGVGLGGGYGGQGYGGFGLGGGGGWSFQRLMFCFY